MNMAAMPDMAKILKILQTGKNIALVGLSPKSGRPSFQVAAYLLSAGYTVIPVNPGHNEILGQPCYPDLVSIKSRVDIVDIFRRAEDVLPIVKEAIAINAKVVWLQLGIVNQAAALVAEEAGLTVIMDRCIKIDHMQLTAKPTMKTL